MPLDPADPVIISEYSHWPLYSGAACRRFAQSQADIIMPLPRSPSFQNEDGWFRQTELVTPIVTNRGNTNDDKSFHS